ncbi:hypothetical protein EMIHUDRAFT_238555 [Emiliania huxleyi CCMP1516]|uniref:RING-type domain-containing protein n=2 Tax=Emiliania huxleyi TaxID=2903 RepID=A0A0D3JLM7_EMIH1|nr:hypothetical protein EMIHUDRAFT_238555 [Emiliania huxleyi CCMP1516]EOD24412.1 hypothetical protein EMIHUDRAFT_238555 [Emiliania huxleyi CCMP1516]|eukprot:XP_005776841.1 hypothetical protein EMIHUDRAFT_238555 [Emiliania huxleyi CCMP1516]
MIGIGEPSCKSLCPICLEALPALAGRTACPCGHVYCSACIQRWAEVSATPYAHASCPLCRSDIENAPPADRRGVLFVHIGERAFVRPVEMGGQRRVARAALEAALAEASHHCPPPAERESQINQ